MYYLWQLLKKTFILKPVFNETLNFNISIKYCKIIVTNSQSKYKIQIHWKSSASK